MKGNSGHTNETSARERLETVSNESRRAIYSVFEWFRVGDQVFHIIMAVVIGALSGLGGVLFLKAIKFFEWAFFHQLFREVLGRKQEIIFLMPLLGGLLIGPLIQRFPKEAKGDGVPSAMEAIALRGGIISPRTVGIRTVTAAITIGSGGSVGREAPIAQIGAAIGSAVGQFMKVSAGRMRSFVACGAAGGIAAVFNAPIGGVFFSLEVLLGDFSAATFAPIVVSSVVSTVVMRALIGNVLVFDMPRYVLASGKAILLSVPLGILCGLMAVLFMASLETSEKAFNSLRLPLWVKPALGGMLTGFIAIYFPHVLGTDEMTVDSAVWGYLPWFMLAVIALLKILATSISLGSGGSGGVLGPCVFIGSVLGAFTGTVASRFMPDLFGLTGGCALIGMASFLAPVIGGPMTSILIVFEMAGNYKIILPLMVSVVISMGVAHQFSRYSLYTYKLHKMGVDLVAGREESVLRSILVQKVMREDFDAVDLSASFNDVITTFFSRRIDQLYLTGKDGALKGVISLMDLRLHLKDQDRWSQIHAVDVATPDPVAMMPNESLLDALNKFAYRNSSQLPVVSDPHERKLVGVIRRSDVLNAYQKSLSPFEVMGPEMFR
ncbi:MAG: chloride channel protein [Syntrophorhabdaceae bacterium]|nr:chloride channel protein [Syntrophorhabdaceae bacterium]